MQWEEPDTTIETDSEPAFAVTESKEVYGWGNSLYGALGVKSSIVSTPVRVGTDISNAVQVAGGGKSGSDDWHKQHR